MRLSIAILSTSLLAGCAGSPPKPPTFKGEYRPVNEVGSKEFAARKEAPPRVFDFNYEGDLVKSLHELARQQPQLNVMPPLGKGDPPPVRVTLQETTLENALRAIGKQGGSKADVIWNRSASQGGNQVFIRFHMADKQIESAETNQQRASND